MKGALPREEKQVLHVHWHCHASPVNRERISRLAHADHPIASPLDDDSVRRLLERGMRPDTERVLDLGCGGGEWLLRALATAPNLRAEGVDISEAALAHAREAAIKLGVHERLTLHRHDAADFTSSHSFDLVLSAGATHAFGGLLPTLAGARKHLAPGRCVLIGDGFWERVPSQEAVEMLGDFTDLATTMERVVADGWTPVHGHVSTRQELSGLGRALWPGGPWTTGPTRTVPMYSRPPPPTAPNGCASTAAPGVSSAWSCARQPTDRGKPLPPRACSDRRRRHSRSGDGPVGASRPG